MAETGKKPTELNRWAALMLCVCLSMCVRVCVCLQLCVCKSDGKEVLDLFFRECVCLEGHARALGSIDVEATSSAEDFH